MQAALEALWVPAPTLPPLCTALAVRGTSRKQPEARVAGQPAVHTACGCRTWGQERGGPHLHSREPVQP